MTLSELKDPLPCTTPTLRDVMAKFITGEARDLPGRNEMETALLLLQAAYCRLAQVPRDTVFAEVICDSDRVMKVFAAPEWDCLSDDGKEWAAAIAEEARMIERGSIIDHLGLEVKRWGMRREHLKRPEDIRICDAHMQQCRTTASVIGTGSHWT